MLPFLCKCYIFFFNLVQPDINTLGIAIKSAPNAEGNEIFVKIQLSNLFLHSHLNSRNEWENKFYVSLFCLFFFVNKD